MVNKPLKHMTDQVVAQATTEVKEVTQMLEQVVVALDIVIQP